MPNLNELATDYTPEQLENAASDARHLMEASASIPKLVAMDILARNMFLLAHSALVSELTDEWEVTNPELVLQTLGASAQRRAIDHPMTPVELRSQLIELAVPVVSIFCEQENDEQESETLHSGDDGDAQGVEEILRGACSDTLNEAAECCSGDQEEAGAAGGRGSDNADIGDGG